MSDARGYIKGLTRFNYWNYPAFNPYLLHKMQTLDMIETSAHQYLSEMYRRDYEAGNVQAIFEYAKADVRAFRAAWVVSQMEAWRQENSDGSFKQIGKLTGAYRGGPGRGRRRDALGETVRLIKRDQAVFKAIMTLHEQGMPTEDCFVEVAKRSWEPSNLATESVREVYRYYQRQVDELMGKPPSRTVRETVEDIMSRLGHSTPDWNQWTIPDAAATWQEALQRLEAMAKRLEDFLGV